MMEGIHGVKFRELKVKSESLTVTFQTIIDKVWKL